MPKRCSLRAPLQRLALAALLASAAPAIAQKPYAGCSVPEAEAEVCPSFTFAPEDVYWNAISGDGSTLVGGVFVDSAGSSISVPTRWIDGVEEPLGPLPEWAIGGYTRSVSYDGSTVVGALSPADTQSRHPWFRWHDGEFELLEVPDDEYPIHYVEDVSGDGSTVVGQLWRNRNPSERDAQAVAWDERGLEILPGDLAYAVSVSGDGSVITGTSQGQPVLWVDRALVPLPLPIGSDRGGAHAVTPDGVFVVGSVSGGAARWEVRDDAMTLLVGESDGGTFYGLSALDVSADGSVIVGTSWNSPKFLQEVFLWLVGNGLRRLEDVLAGDLGLDLQGLQPRAVQVHCISDDGRRLIGYAAEGDADWPWQPFYADLSPPIGIDIEPGSASNEIDLSGARFVSVRVFGTERLDISDIDVNALTFGPTDAPVAQALRARDANRDGYPDREFRFETGEAGIAAGDTEACLTGRAMGLPFEVCGPVQAALLGCGRGAELALLLPAAVLLRRRRVRGGATH